MPGSSAPRCVAEIEDRGRSVLGLAASRNVCEERRARVERLARDRLSRAAAISPELVSMRARTSQRRQSSGSRSIAFSMAACAPRGRRRPRGRARSGGRGMPPRAGAAAHPRHGRSPAPRPVTYRFLARRDLHVGEKRDRLGDDQRPDDERGRDADREAPPRGTRRSSAGFGPLCAVAGPVGGRAGASRRRSPRSAPRSSRSRGDEPRREAREERCDQRALASTLRRSRQTPATIPVTSAPTRQTKPRTPSSPSVSR